MKLINIKILYRALLLFSFVYFSESLLLHARPGLLISTIDGEEIPALSVTVTREKVEYVTLDGDPEVLDKSKYAGFTWVRDIDVITLDTVEFSACAFATSLCINGQATVTGPYTVDVVITTDLPDSAILAVDMGLSGQRGSDTFIGIEYKRVPIKKGIARVTLDGSVDSFPRGSSLPTGLYDVQVSFHPRWKENRMLAQELSINESIMAIGVVELSASGNSKEMIEESGWFLDNFTSGMGWNPEYMQKMFGKFEQLKNDGQGNPNIIKLYYFDSIGITFTVNSNKRQIVSYHYGKIVE